MIRTSLGSVTLVLASACFNPATPDPQLTAGDDSGGTTGASTLGDDDDDDGPSTAQPTGNTSVDPDSTGGIPEGCGDGDVEGSEVCDDGVNDGSYGGCMPDCSALADHCGDATVNGTEVCDDGVNDEGYGSCSADCSAQGPHCGDMAVQDPELCDLGDAGNVDGTGCNHDCVISGTRVGMFMQAGLDMCDGTFATPPAIRGDGHVMVAATGYCNDDDVLMVELDETATLVQQFDLLLPNTPLRGGVIVGDSWLLLSSGCNYVVSTLGALTEVCEDRVFGVGDLEADTAGEYVAVDYDVAALFPAGAPVLGVGPTWSITPPDNQYYDFSYATAVFGESGSVVIGGSERYIPDNTSYAYLARFTAAGNLAGDYSFGEAQSFSYIHPAPDGGIVAVADYPSYVIVSLDANLAVEWTLPVPTEQQIQADVDSTGAVVLAFFDTPSQAYVIVKYTSDLATQLWTHALDGVDYSFWLRTGADDSIWVTTANYAQNDSDLTVQKFAP